jgi:hydrogenase maturation protease
VAAVGRLLERYQPPPGVQVLDGGTLGLSLLPYLQDADRVILVDAIAADAPPGSLVRLEGEDVSHAAAHRLSVHQIGVKDLLDGVRLLGQTPPTVVLHGVVPASLEVAVALSEPVDAALPGLVERVVEEAALLGFVLRPR